MNVRLHKNARTTPQIRKDIQQSEESVRFLAKKYSLSVPTAVCKWKNRDSVEDR